MSENDSGALFAAPAVSVTSRADGSQLAHSEVALQPYSRAVGEWLLSWADEAPTRVFLAERQAAGWRQVTYGEALAQVRALATWMLGHGLGADRPLMILSDNSIEHALLTLAAMQVGVPAVPVSPAYSLLSQDHAKLKAIVRTIAPGAIFVASAERFAPALAAIADSHGAILIDGAGDSASADLGYPALLATTDTDLVDRAFRSVGPDTIAKILFTSGSTGVPKGVINTQRMLCASQQAKLQVWPFLARTPPVIVDWLPWNHTFGGNHNFNMVLRNGGTLYIDGGKAAPGLFDKTLENLREISPTIYFNVPRGYDFLRRRTGRRPRASRSLLPAPASHLLRRGRPAPAPLGGAGTPEQARPRTAGADGGRLGIHRDRTAGNRLPLPGRAERA